MNQNDTSTGGIGRALLALWAGGRLSITTPTGNQFDAMKDGGEVLITEESGYTVSGEPASRRLEKCLRAVGTEWEIVTDTDHTTDAEGNLTMPTENQNLELTDALEAVDEVADEIADEDMHGATREMVAEGTAQRIRDRLRLAAMGDD